MPEILAPHPVVPARLLLFPPAVPCARDLIATPGLELTFNARGALMRAFGELAATTSPRRRVLVPAYHCPSAIAPVLHAGLEPIFYRIRRDLSIDYEDLLAKADAQTAAVLVIHFFGVAPDLTPLAPVRHSGVRLIEDCSHSFLQSEPISLAGNAASDFRVYSFWKTVPSGAGGALLRAQPSATSMPLQAPWTARARNYKRLLEESIAHSGTDLARSALHCAETAWAKLRRVSPAVAADVVEADAAALLRHGETYYPLDPDVSSATMPAHCRRIIEGSDLKAIVARRRTNFERYAGQADMLGPMRPLMATLPPHACPWVYPVLLEHRSTTDFRLRAAGVQLHTFGIYLHSALFMATDLRTIQDAEFLAEQVLCLAIHQDLDNDDIDRAVQVMRREFACQLTDDAKR